MEMRQSCFNLSSWDSCISGVGVDVVVAAGGGGAVAQDDKSPVRRAVAAKIVRLRRVLVVSSRNALRVFILLSSRQLSRPPQASAVSLRRIASRLKVCLECNYIAMCVLGSLERLL